MSALAAAKAGDEQAFVELTSPHSRRLHLHCYRMLGSLHDADDALQETMLRAWKGLPRFEPRAELSTWLYPASPRTSACGERSSGPGSPSGSTRISSPIRTSCSTRAPGPTPRRSAARTSASPSSPRSSSCRRSNGRSWCCATRSTGRRRTSPGSSTTPSPQSTARSSGAGAPGA